MSFRGPDVRRGFVDCLYSSLTANGIRVFRDDDELPQITPPLIIAIKQSKIAIPIISKYYASSKSCLMELQQIMECRKNNGQMIIPIFYHVDSIDLLRLKGSFEESFYIHEKQGVDRETIDKWKMALRDIALIKGFYFNNNRPEGMGIDLVVSEVLRRLKKRDLNVFDLDVLDERVERSIIKFRRAISGHDQPDYSDDYKRKQPLST